MKIIKDIKNDEDKILASSILSKLKIGNRVFGAPAEALRRTLKNKEKELIELNSQKGKLDYLSVDGEIKQEIQILKAGIKGEEELGEYLERIVKYDDQCEDIIFFASLADMDHQITDEYIADTDFIAIYGKSVLIIDAKNIRTNLDTPLYLEMVSNNVYSLCAVGGVLVVDLHGASHIWENIFRKNNIEVESIEGCAVIVNETGMIVWKNSVYAESKVKPVHISELVNFLHDWMKGKNPETSLDMLVAMSKMQVKKPATDLDLSQIKMKFKI